MERLIGDALTNSEKKDFKHAHLRQTRKLVTGDSLKQALNKIKILNDKQSKQISSGSPSNISLLYPMVSDCIQYGTIPFSILART